MRLSHKHFNTIRYVKFPQQMFLIWLNVIYTNFIQVIVRNSTKEYTSSTLKMYSDLLKSIICNTVNSSISLLLSSDGTDCGVFEPSEDWSTFCPFTVIESVLFFVMDSLHAD